MSHAFFSAALGSKKDPHSCFDPVSKRGRQLAAGRVGSRYMYVPGSETIMRTEGSPASGVPGVASTPCEVKNDHRCRRGGRRRKEEEGGGKTHRLMCEYSRIPMVDSCKLQHTRQHTLQPTLQPTNCSIRYNTHTHTHDRVLE